MAEDDPGRVSKGHCDLIAWQRSMNLIEAVYELTRSLPSEERFGLVNQMRRCAVSVPSNIAEGEGRRGAGDFTRFLSIALCSLRELETQIEICQRLRYIDNQAFDTLFNQSQEIGCIISGLMRSVRGPS